MPNGYRVGFQRWTQPVLYILWQAIDLRRHAKIYALNCLWKSRSRTSVSIIILAAKP